MNPALYQLEIGVNDRNKWDTWNNYKRKALKIIIHPSFDYKSIRNDLALIKLDVFNYFLTAFWFFIQDIFDHFKMAVNTDTSTYNVVPVCVPDGRENYADRYGFATGFGKITQHVYDLF